jgi:hypothetical protein
MDPYDSDSSDGGSEFPSQSTIPEPPPFNDPNYETYKHGQRFLIVDHTANQRNRSEISKIWQHGGERRRVDDGTMDRYWRCGHCNNKTILKCPETGRGATNYPIRHLKNRHFTKMTSLRSFSTPLISYPAQQCQPSASESSPVQRSSLPLRETIWGWTLSRPANA